MGEAILIFFSMLFLFGIAFGPQIFVLVALREIRKAAEAMPERDRERWYNEAVASLSKGLK